MAVARASVQASGWRHRGLGSSRSPPCGGTGTESGRSLAVFFPFCLLTCRASVRMGAESGRACVWSQARGQAGTSIGCQIVVERTR